jgi:hypothetical protein
MNYLIDTDILVDWLRGKKFAARFLREAKGVFYYSSITRKELLTGCRDTAEIVQVQNLLRTMRIVRIDPIIALKASELVDKYTSAPLHKADSLIAATACVKKLILVTRNRKHFEFIEEIQILVPKEG